MKTKKPGLFGLTNSNRDFTNITSWGKNQFNSSFPAALCCFLHSKSIEANYLSMSNGVLKPDLISIKEVFCKDPADPDIYFSFESQHSPYQKFVIGSLPRTDLVIQSKSTGNCLAGLEIKLTALPDNTTCNLTDDLYGSEIVVRPDSIVYLACSIANRLNIGQLKNLVPSIDIADWADPREVITHINLIVNTVKEISVKLESSQTAFLLQPIWKTIGKSSVLAENCLDMFVWSNAGFINFISSIAKDDAVALSINRQTRTAIWLFKMLLDIKEKGSFDPATLIDQLSYNTRNDKAFASAGNVTNKYMTCPRLKNPILNKSQIKDIIIGGGQNLLSPERRFDSILFNTPDLFL